MIQRNVERKLGLLNTGQVNNKILGTNDGVRKFPLRFFNAVALNNRRYDKLWTISQNKALLSTTTFAY